AAPAPAPAAPAPAAPAPAPAPGGGSSGAYGLGTGTSRGSAAQGVAAVEAARTKIGLPYLWAGTGPDGYDCSGLTGFGWRAAGVNLQRTSRQQYVQVKKISYAEMRPGDLVFWGSDPSDPQSIHHVAMYAGNGKIVEAARPGTLLREVPMRYAGSMPFAGRP
ncbi:C40 family peptidase, partial [Cellulomonas endophytica]|uniref:C40 family peptidase n=1 Tax=Cellulomonas endophytica TaxID=2494735 RepID=UPI0013E92E1A